MGAQKLNKSLGADLHSNYFVIITRVPAVDAQTNGFSEPKKTQLSWQGPDLPLPGTINYFLIFIMPLSSFSKWRSVLPFGEPIDGSPEEVILGIVWHFNGKDLHTYSAARQRC